MLTGELPSGTIAPPSRKTPMDPRVDDVVLRALARQKEERFRTAAEIRTCVENITNSPASLTGKLPDVPPAAQPHPIPIAPWLIAPLTIGLLALLVLMLSDLRHLPSYLLREVMVLAQEG